MYLPPTQAWESSAIGWYNARMKRQPASRRESMFAVLPFLCALMCVVGALILWAALPALGSGGPVDAPKVVTPAHVLTGPEPSEAPGPVPPNPAPAAAGTAEPGSPSAQGPARAASMPTPLATSGAAAAMPTLLPASGAAAAMPTLLPASGEAASDVLLPLIQEARARR